MSGEAYKRKQYSVPHGLARSVSQSKAVAGKWIIVRLDFLYISSTWEVTSQSPQERTLLARFGYQ